MAKGKKKIQSFKETHTFEVRKEQADKIRKKYANRIPVVAEKYKKSNLPEIEKKKYLLPEDLTVAQFQYVIRKRVKLDPQQTLFTYVVSEKTGKPSPILPSTTSTMAKIHEEHRDPDGFLYIIYTEEDVFGAEL
eukprot:m.239763 g.239763  ORF g.239763 m.239763 type:complete len:134 (+) comp14025_c0_seq1:145-546(+)